jgi:hypothetical protein
MPRPQFSLRALLLFVLFAVPGVGIPLGWIVNARHPSNETIRTYPVSGRVVFADGRPASYAQVNIELVSPQRFSVSASGVTDSEGRFKASTFQNNEGAAASTRWVTVIDSGGNPLHFADGAARIMIKPTATDVELRVMKP